jgi:tripartite-type tricarboxylate transporter receptor subunit TctC
MAPPISRPSLAQFTSIMRVETIMKPERRIGVAAAVLLVAASAGSASAQVYPSRPITMVVPFAAGGPLDTLARNLAERMRGSLGQSLVIENVTGASGSTGTGRVARAVADGYTIVLGNMNTHVINGAVFNLQYDTVKDFEPISLLASQPLLIVAKKAMPAANLQELITWLKANPASQGTSGAGSITHLAGVLFGRETGTRLNLVPYRGVAFAINDLVAGQVDMMFDPAPNSLPHVRAGSIKAYAVTATSRLATAPDIPTVAEAGLPGFHISPWQAIWAPKSTPRAIVDRLNAAVVDAIADPATRSRLGELGYQVFPREQQNPEALNALQKSEIDRWWPIIKAAGIKLD